MSEEPSVTHIVRGGVWLYLSSIVNNVSGLLYWLVILAVGGSAILGYTSATIGLSTLVAGIVSLGVPLGLQRFIGKSLGENNVAKVREYFFTSLTFMLIIYCTASLILIVIGLSGFSFGNFLPEMFLLAAFLTLLNPLTTIMRSLFSSHIKTEYLLLGTILGNIGKFALGVTLVTLAGLGWIGATLGYAVIPLSMLIVGLVFITKHVGVTFTFKKKCLADILKAGLAGWLPQIVVLAGQWLSVLAVFGYTEASTTGHFYIAFTLASAVLLISTSLSSLLLPALSGMADGRKRAAWKAFKIGFSAMIPVATVLLAYPKIPAYILGESYSDIVLPLQILVLAVIPVALTMSVNSLTYAYGKYREVLGMGLVQNIPRIILYPTLTPTLRAPGAAIAFLVGSLTGLVYSLKVSSKIGYKINWKDIAKLTTPIPIAYMVAKILPWHIGSIALLLTFTIISVNVLEENELKEAVEAIIPKRHQTKTLKILEKLRLNFGNQ
ncbi:MAG: hypothetical protein DRO40_04395 [Thermoprotei archaeon]|nr:MAG: hypothetical protein DRO40_04395 [Thermoprotei archaeon]